MASNCPHCTAPVTRVANFCPRCGRELTGATPGDSEFIRWQRKRNKRLAIFCGAAIPVGFLFLWVNPFTTLIVSGLGALGLAVCLRRLQRLRAG